MPIPRLAVLLMLLAGTPALAQTPSHESVNHVLADAVILPAYQRWAKQAAGLAPAIDPLCDAPDAAALERARDAFHGVMDAWQAVLPVAIGPITEGTRPAAVQFWPDSHGIAGRQLNQALAEQDPALPADLAGQSVGLQNLQALEVLLFGVDLLDGTPKAAYACSLAAAIGRRQGELAAEVLDDWRGSEGFHADFTGAAAGNDHYFDAEDATTDLFRSLTQTIEAIVALKLERPLGDDLDSAKPRRAESWRSARSMRNVERNLATIEAVYATPGGLGVWLEGTRPGLHQRVLEVLAASREAAAAVATPLAAAVEDAAARQDVVALLDQVRALRILMRTTVADAAGITVGFNSMDGD